MCEWGQCVSGAVCEWGTVGVGQCGSGILCPCSSVRCEDAVQFTMHMLMAQTSCVITVVDGIVPMNPGEALKMST